MYLRRRKQSHTSEYVFSMKLILMTTPSFFVEEHQILNALFEEGLERLHLRKPNTEPVY